VDRKKIKLKVLASFFEIIPVTRLKDFDTENSYRNGLCFFQIIPEASCDKLILTHFPCGE
jgi:hypothetical protein